MSEFIHTGFDSRWFKTIPAGTGYSFGMIKLTEGDWFNNSIAPAQRDAVIQAGMQWGGFCFYRDAADPIAQAKYFHEYARSLGSMDIHPVLDIEDNQAAKKNIILQRVAICAKEIEQLFGRPVIIYSADWYWNAWIDQPVLADKALWAVDWPVWPHPNEGPSLPRNGGWTQTHVVAWQKWGEIAKPGFGANIDIDVAKAAFLGVSPPPPSPKVPIEIRVPAGKVDVRVIET